MECAFVFFFMTNNIWGGWGGWEEGRTTQNRHPSKFNPLCINVCIPKTNTLAVSYIENQKIESRFLFFFMTNDIWGGWEGRIAQNCHPSQFKPWCIKVCVPKTNTMVVSYEWNLELCSSLWQMAFKWVEKKVEHSKSLSFSIQPTMYKVSIPKTNTLPKTPSRSLKQ